MAPGNLGWVRESTNRLVLVSQTCDVVRDCRENPFIALAAVAYLEEPLATEARRGHRPRLVPLPGIGLSAFADMDLVVSAEKSALLEAQQTRGLRDPEDQRRFARAVGRVYQRPALRDDLNESLRGLVQRVKAKHDRDSDEGRLLDSLVDIRVAERPTETGNKIHVTVMFCPASRAQAEATAPGQTWDEYLSRWVGRANKVGIVASIDGYVVPLDEMSARDYLATDPLDLDYLTTRVS